METETREKLRKWSEELEKVDEATKRREAEAWCLSALAILEEDNSFRGYCQARRIGEER